MGGICGKNERLCVFPKRVARYKAKGKKTSGTAHVFCDASTWTGENHFHSARIGRTPKGPELSAAEFMQDAPESESAAQAEGEPGEQAASLHARHTEAPLAGTAGDTRGVGVSQDPEANPSTEVMQHQEFSEQTKQEAWSARRSPQESRKSKAIVRPAGSCTPSEQHCCEDHEVTPLPQSTVKAEVHMSVDGQGEPGKAQPAPAQGEPQAGAEQEAGAVHASKETPVGKAHRDVPVQQAAACPAALCATEESELPSKIAETREGNTAVQRSAAEQVCCAAPAPPHLQLGRAAEVPITEDTGENAFEPEQADEMAEVCGDGQTSEEIPCSLAETHAAPQDEEIKGNNVGKAEEH